VRVLLDENLPHDLSEALSGHFVSTVQGLGWDGTKNGALLKRASGLIDAFVTIDGNLQYQQNVSVLPFGIVVVGAASNRVQFVNVSIALPTFEAACRRTCRARDGLVGEPLRRGTGD
jgi:hypothetical protein